MFKERKSTLWWAGNTKGWLGRSRDSTFKLRPQLSMQERGHLLEQRLLFEIGEFTRVKIQYHARHTPRNQYEADRHP